MEKKISVVIPCYNVEKQIDRCMNSLVRQTIGVDHLELIFVDDCSQDGTVKRLRVWEKRYPNSIIIVECEENGRQGKARNIGKTFATAPYLSYIDADDWVDKEMYQVLYEKGEESQAEIIVAQSARDFGDGEYCHYKPYEGITEELVRITNDEERHNLLKVGICGGVWGKLYRKGFLEEHNIVFPENLTYEDNYFGTLVLFCVKTLYVTRECYYHYYLNPNSTVATGNSPHQFHRLEVACLTMDELIRRGYGEKYHYEILNNFVMLYYMNTLHILFTRFDQLPYDILDSMVKEVLRRFPNFLTDEKIADFRKEFDFFMLTFQEDMTKEKWDCIGEVYRDHLKGK